MNFLRKLAGVEHADVKGGFSDDGEDEPSSGEEEEEEGRDKGRQQPEGAAAEEVRVPRGVQPSGATDWKIPTRDREEVESEYDEDEEDDMLDEEEAGGGGGEGDPSGEWGGTGREEEEEGYDDDDVETVGSTVPTISYRESAWSERPDWDVGSQAALTSHLSSNLSSRLGTASSQRLGTASSAGRRPGSRGVLSRGTSRPESPWVPAGTIKEEAGQSWEAEGGNQPADDSEAARQRPGSGQGSSGSAPSLPGAPAEAVGTGDEGHESRRASRMSSARSQRGAWAVHEAAGRAAPADRLELADMGDMGPDEVVVLSEEGDFAGEGGQEGEEDEGEETEEERELTAEEQADWDQARYMRFVVQKAKQDLEDAQAEAEREQMELQSRRRAFAARAFLCVAAVATLAATPAFLNSVLPNPGCPAGSYFGKLPSDRFWELKECQLCPIGTHSRAGGEGVAACYCSGGSYASGSKCVQCDRGLWVPTGVGTNRSDCRPLEEYWRLGGAGQGCEEACGDETPDADALRTWDANVDMVSLMEILSFNLGVPCADYRLSYRSSGPWVCWGEDCGPIRLTCFYPSGDLRSERDMTTPLVARKFCSCYNATMFENKSREVPYSLE